jgi:single-stranded DNA-binding protein
VQDAHRQQRPHDQRRRRLDQPPPVLNVTIWAGVGEWAALHLAKGDKVVLAGRLKWSEWDASDGKRQAIEIHADSVVPITLRDAWETHEDSGANTNPVGDEDIPI